MIDQTHVEALYDCDVIDNQGEKIGSVKRVWLEDGTGRPMWAEVHTGLLGMRESFVPIQQGSVAGGAITVPVSKQQVKDAPSLHTDHDQMTDEEQDELYRHYGMIPQAKTGEHDRLDGAAGRQAAGQRTGDRTGRHAGDAAEVTLSEERLDVGTRKVESGRVRLVKHTVTEERTVTVPVTHEEVRVVREPVEGGAADRAFADEQAEVTLHREEPVVQKRAEATERVRLEKDAVTEQRDIKGEVRKERVDVEREGDRHDRR